MNSESKIYVAGHRGLVGGGIYRALLARGYVNLIVRSHAELDLTDEQSVAVFFATEKPEFVFLAAAKVGGIHANNIYPAEFIRENLAIQSHVIDNAYRSGATKLLFLGSSCIYPREAPQPIHEDSFMTGPLEPTNRAYAVAKIAGIEMCDSYNRQFGTNFISVMPTNIYGPGDNYDLENSHVLPALIRKFHEALPDRPVTVWGTGGPRREFLYSDDLAEACLFLMSNYDGPEIINVGAGDDITIRDLALLVQQVLGHSGAIVWDSSRPDGTPRKLLDSSRINALGWRPSISLSEGIRRAHEDYCISHAST